MRNFPEFFSRLRRRQDIPYLTVKPFNHGTRHASGTHQPKPADNLATRDGLRGGCHIRKQRRALAARNGNRSQLAAANLLQSAPPEGTERKLDMASKKRRFHFRTSLEWYVHEPCFGEALKLFKEQMRRTS